MTPEEQAAVYDLLDLRVRMMSNLRESAPGLHGFLTSAPEAERMSYSTRERISHVVRRLGIGARPDLVDAAASPADAIATALDLSTPPVPPPDIPAPADHAAAREQRIAAPVLGYWLEQMATSPRRIEERLVWFWHDHFATSLRKVQIQYLMWQQHLTMRDHAIGSFADLLRAISRDPAMLFFLDGVQNRRDAVNENFGREAMELFTMGRGHFDESDVLAAARSCTGWVVNVPGRRDRALPVAPWQSLFVPFRHDGGTKTLLGVTGRHDMDAALDIMLDHPATAETVAAKLYVELVGLRPDPATAARLGAAFRRDYRVMTLVEEIVADPVFLSDEAIRVRVRTPLEKAVGLVQGFATHPEAGRAVFAGLEAVRYVPLLPPNVAGFPSGPRLLGPHTLVHAFDFVMALRPDQPVPEAAEAFARLGVHDVSEQSLAVVAGADSAPARIALALTSPEYSLT